MGFGLFQHTIDQIRELQDEIQEFHSAKKDSAFVLFIGALNHWVTLIVHKTVKWHNVVKPPPD